MSIDPVCSLIGLAAKGRNVVSGEYSTENAIKSGKAFVVIVAKDASDNTKKSFSDKCAYRNVPIYFYGDKDMLGHAIGCEMRASLAIIDEGLSKAIIKKIEGMHLMEDMNEGK